MDFKKLNKANNEFMDKINEIENTDTETMKELFFEVAKLNCEIVHELAKEYSEKVVDEIINENKNKDNTFVKGVNQMITNHKTTNTDILNWYRNLYYKEELDTERYIMAKVINGLFMEMKDKGINLTGCYK